MRQLDGAESRMPRVIDYTLSGALLIVLVLLSLFDLPFFSRHLMGGVFFFVLGTMFMIAYFFENTIMLFRMIVWICKNLSVPSGRYMAIVYGCLFFAAGCFELSNAMR